MFYGFFAQRVKLHLYHFWYYIVLSYYVFGLVCQVPFIPYTTWQEKNTIPWGEENITQKGQERRDKGERQGGRRRAQRQGRRRHLIRVSCLFLRCRRQMPVSLPASLPLSLWLVPPSSATASDDEHDDEAPLGRRGDMGLPHPAFALGYLLHESSRPKL